MIAAILIIKKLLRSDLVSSWLKHSSLKDKTNSISIIETKIEIQNVNTFRDFKEKYLQPDGQIQTCQSTKTLR